MNDVTNEFLVFDGVVSFQERFEALHCCEEDRLLRVLDILLDEVLHKDRVTLKTAISVS